MSKIKQSLIVFIVSILVSCSSYKHSYFQVFKTTAEKGDIKDNWITYVEDDVVVRYNFRSNKGYILFEVLNNSNEDIVIDLDKTFFVLNNEAKEYYTQETTTQSVAYSNSEAVLNKSYLYRDIAFAASGSSSSESSSAITNKQFLTIPPLTFRTFRKFNLIDDYFEHCDLNKFPRNTKSKIVNFTTKDSPIKFSNIITFKQNDKPKRVSHNFYVNEISNYTYSEVIVQVDKDECGNYIRPIDVLNFDLPNMFYYRYFYYK
jgi:hypothetical protein